ncbi:MAG: monovalent cation/H+ antiporter subunit D family protein [Lentisphaeria bacterium]|nr:monovalent cation/H+ antiporter subunit D family protein [Lentisphaeria bacterium]
MSTNSTMPLIICLTSLLATIPILVFGRNKNLREFFTFLAAIITVGLVFSMVPTILDGKTIEYSLIELVPNVSLKFRVDGLGMIFAIVASVLWLITSIYVVGYMRGLKEHAQTRFFACFALAISATMAVAFAANLLTLYIFYELLSLSTYPLVTHHQDKEARGGGRKYLSYLMGTSIAFALPAMIYIYMKTNETGLEFAGSGFLVDFVSRGEAKFLLLLLVFGFAKSGLMPFHSWLPGAMVAPTPVSALLHAVAVVKVGVFCILRVFTGVFGIKFLQSMDLGTMIAWIAAFTVIVSSLIALSQDNLKRRLAFSTIGQLAYIIMGVSLLSPKAVTGSMLHIAMHASGKITLFFCAGAIFVATGKKYISEMKGIGKQMPITMLCFFIGSMSIIGLPFTGGFISKFYLVSGAAQAEQFPFLCVYLISSVLNVAYFFPIVFNAFFCKEEDSLFENKINEAPVFCVLPLAITAFLSVGLFFCPDVIYDLTQVFLAMKG